MLILIEGPDCAGKTTLASRIVDRIRRDQPHDTVSYRHHAVPVGHALTEYVEPLLDYQPSTDRHVVCDRYHVGETVYPRVTGRDSTQTPGVRAYVEQFLRTRGALLVYCHADDARLTACGVARGDDDVELGRVAATTRAFRSFVASETLLTPVTVDVTDPNRADYDLIVDAIVGQANAWDYRARELIGLTTYVGPRRPSLLLVGDRRGTPSHDLATFGSWPAFAPFPSTSGAYLMDTLTTTPLSPVQHGVTLGDVGLINACDVDEVASAWEILYRPSVVALGLSAHRKLAELDVPHRNARHPQYVRRFHHNLRDEYLLSLVDRRDVEVTV